MSTTTLLKLYSSGRVDSSLSRELTDRLADELAAKARIDRVVERDLLDGVGFVHPDWIGANFTPAAERSDAQVAALAESNTLVDELMGADVLVMGVPIYNFSVPAALKAWIDMVCRAGRTFTYSKTGPKGLLEDKKAYVIVTSGGTEVDSSIDFATPYLRHVLGFIGIHDVEVIRADRTVPRGAEAGESARQQIDELVLA